jgi:prepilin-type N-terminal cleavage/methylation domain-containing protein
MKKRAGGFTLLEVSIVLVIIAIIIGSVVITNSMIRDAQLRNVVAEAQRYTQLIADFRDKYGALPGDFAAATDLWGTAHAVLNTCKVTIGNGTQTCDGDGNGRISSQTAATYYEEFRAWQHLQNANMIESTVTGTPSPSTHGRVVGTNIPMSQLSEAGWGLTSVLPGDISGGTVTEIPYFTGDLPPNHVLWFGGSTYNGESTNRQDPVLKVAEAAVLDGKVDDGRPNTGKVVTQLFPVASACAAGNCHCTDDSTVATADYRLSLSNYTICALVFKTGF